VPCRQQQHPTGTPNGVACARISVPQGRGHAINGSLYMVDVIVGESSPFQYLLGKLGLLRSFDQGAEMVPAKSVLGSTPPDQLSCQGSQQMTGATSSAAVVALRQLGYQANQHNLGAQLYEVAPGTIGDVGGVAQKTVAVRRAGAKVFFVPADQFKDAQSQAGSLKVYPVKTLEQARRPPGPRRPYPSRLGSQCWCLTGRMDRVC
jgi:PDZ domain-containing secreted protein